MRVVIFALATCLIACAPESGTSGAGTGAAPTSLWGTSWIGKSVAGKTVSPPGAITLNFRDGSAGGNSGCNTYGGNVTIQGSDIKFGGLFSTKMACLEDGRMQQELAYTSLLSDAVRFERPTTDQMTIFASDGRSVSFTAKR